jgi:hypothetical protein
VTADADNFVRKMVEGNEMNIEQNWRECPTATTAWWFTGQRANQQSAASVFPERAACLFTVLGQLPNYVVV